jgi:hypothetical protein
MRILCNQDSKFGLLCDMKFASILTVIGMKAQKTALNVGNILLYSLNSRHFLSDLIYHFYLRPDIPCHAGIKVNFSVCETRHK